MPNFRDQTRHRHTNPAHWRIYPTWLTWHLNRYSIFFFTWNIVIHKIFAITFCTSFDWCAQHFKKTEPKATWMLLHFNLLMFFFYAPSLSHSKKWIFTVWCINFTTLCDAGTILSFFSCCDLIHCSWIV